MEVAVVVKMAQNVLIGAAAFLLAIWFTFKGKDVTQFPPNKLAEMGMIRTFQIPRPFKELTVHDNVAVGTLFNPERIKQNAYLNRRIH
jgi:ABC-type branched-subunit amino acid transport system ATPase component